jgi:hypothetical protein
MSSGNSDTPVVSDSARFDNWPAAPAVPGGFRRLACVPHHARGAPAGFVGLRRRQHGTRMSLVAAFCAWMDWLIFAAIASSRPLGSPIVVVTATASLVAPCTAPVSSVISLAAEVC